MKFDVLFSNPRGLKTFYLKTQFLEKMLRRSIISFIYIYIWFLEETFVSETKWRNFLTYMIVYACINRNIYILVKWKFLGNFFGFLWVIYSRFFICIKIKILRMLQSVRVNLDNNGLWISQWSLDAKFYQTL